MGAHHKSNLASAINTIFSRSNRLSHNDALSPLAGFSLKSLNTRPDAQTLEQKSGQPRIQLTLHDRRDPLTLRSAETSYITLYPSSEQFNTSPSVEKKYRLTPIVVENSLFVELASEQEVHTLLLEEHPSPIYHHNSSQFPWLEKLHAAQFWLTDRAGASKEKIKVGMPGLQDVLLLSSGDFLRYREGAWSKGGLEMAEGCPLAQVLAADKAGLKFLVWDETGFFHQQINITPLSLPPYPFARVETLFSSLKQRSRSEVSGMMGKKRVILRPGTLWLNRPDGWTRLKTVEEIQDYLAYRIIGELIIIDAFDTSPGKCLVKGRQINPLRTDESTFSLIAPNTFTRAQSIAMRTPKTASKREFRSFRKSLRR